MTLDEFLKSPDFRSFLDETLREEAVRTVETLLSRTSPVKRRQLHSIPAAIQGEGYSGLAKMTQKQKKKNSSTRNKAFWLEMDNLLSKTSNSDISLFNFLKAKLSGLGILESESEELEKKKMKQVRKRNNNIVKELMDRILIVYFEHFTCHYFYKSAKGDQR